MGRLFVPSEFQLCVEYSMLPHGSGSKSFECETNTITSKKRSRLWVRSTLINIAILNVWIFVNSCQVVSMLFIDHSPMNIIAIPNKRIQATFGQNIILYYLLPLPLSSLPLLPYPLSSPFLVRNPTPKKLESTQSLPRDAFTQVYAFLEKIFKYFSLYNPI